HRALRPGVARTARPARPADMPVRARAQGCRGARGTLGATDARRRGRLHGVDRRRPHPSSLLPGPPRGQAGRTRRARAARTAPVPGRRRAAGETPVSAAGRSASRGTRSPRRVEVAGIAISNPDRVMYPDAGVTKLELARYYERVADWMLPHITGRPLSLVFCPEGIDGECVYLKHARS